MRYVLFLFLCILAATNAATLRRLRTSPSTTSTEEEDEMLVANNNINAKYRNLAGEVDAETVGRFVKVRQMAHEREEHQQHQQHQQHHVESSKGELTMLQRDLQIMSMMSMDNDMRRRDLQDIMSMSM